MSQCSSDPPVWLLGSSALKVSVLIRVHSRPNWFLICAYLPRSAAKLLLLLVLIFKYQITNRGPQRARFLLLRVMGWKLPNYQILRVSPRLRLPVGGEISVLLLPLALPSILVFILTSLPPRPLVFLCVLCGELLVLILVLVFPGAPLRPPFLCVSKALIFSVSPCLRGGFSFLGSPR